MENTKNINLALPDDGSEEWGAKLNNNFQIIDSKIGDVVTVATNNFINSGLYKSVDLNDYVMNDNLLTLTLPSFYCYLPLLNNSLQGTNLPGTITIASTVIESNNEKIINYFEGSEDEYKIFYYGIVKNGINYVIDIFDSSDYFINNLTDSIYLGSFVIYKELSNENYIYKFAKGLDVLKPWFCNVSATDRIVDIETHGTLNGGYINYNNNNLKAKEEYTWVHEGINCSNLLSSGFVKRYVEKDSSGNIKFFRAYNNKKVDESELVINIQLDGSKYLNNNNPENVPNGKYTIQRYGILENGYSVVFYGDEIYNSLDEAKANLAMLKDIKSIVSFKEVAKIIINNDSTYKEIINLNEVIESANASYFNDKYFTIYHDEDNKKGSIKFNSSNNNNELSTNILKKNYSIADAADTYSNGIIPNINNNFILNNNTIEYNSFAAALVSTNYNVSNSSIIKIDVPQGIYELPINNISKWNKLIWTINGFNLIDIATNLDENMILIGSIYYNAENSKYESFIAAPYLVCTNPSARTDFKYSKISINGLLPYINNEDNISLGNGIIKAEGIKYNSLSNYNLNIISNEAVNIEWYEIDKNGKLLKDNKVNTLTRPSSGKWLIYKILIAGNGEYYLCTESEEYNSQQNAIENCQSSLEMLNINNNIMTEISRLIVGNSGEIKVFYTNQKILGSLEIKVLNAEDLPTEFNINDFGIYQPTDTSKKITFTNEDNTSPIVKVYSNGCGIGNIKVDINNPVDKYFLQYKAATEQTPAHFELAAVDLSSLENRIQEIENKINNASTGLNNTVHFFNGTPPASGSIGQIYFQPISGTNPTTYYIKFWNGNSWENLNSWQ